MLQTLHVRNLALVAELDVEFGAGLNAVTGETGAGKSLIIGALQLLLGERAGPTVIRRGADRCEAAAVIRFGPDFTQVQSAVDALLAEAGAAPCEDHQLLLRRVVTRSHSRAFANSTLVTLQLLRRLGDLLVDIHGPHEHQSLLQPVNQLALLNAYAGLEAATEQCAQLYRHWQDALQALEAARGENVPEGRQALLRAQLAEIEGVGPAADEEEDLTERHGIAANARRLLEIASQCRAGLTEAEGAVTEQLSQFVRLIHELENTDPTGGRRFAVRMEEAVSLLQELSYEFDAYAENVDVDAEELARIEERLDLLQRLRRKYGPTLEDVLLTASELREQLAATDGRRARLAQLEAAAASLEAEYRAQSDRLSSDRLSGAAELAADIAARLRGLGFTRSRFEIQRKDAVPGPRGADQVEFCFAPNPGEDLRALRQIASSGEIARVMLAIKTVLSVADKVPILIFDEVDANVGGRIAVQVAEQLDAIAARHQVLCITHLPQIAVAGDIHFRVSKQVAGGRTSTSMLRLDAVGREHEITRMLGAPKSSRKALEHAREMLSARTREGCPDGGAAVQVSAAKASS